KDRAPLFFRQEIDKIFRVEKSGGVGAVVWTAHLRDDLRHLGKRSQYLSALFGDTSAFRGSGARRQGTAHPDRAFIQVRQKFRTDHAAERQEKRERKNCQRCDKNGQAMPYGPGHPISIARRKIYHQRVLPALAALLK